jgi:hypothetical protein
VPGFVVGSSRDGRRCRGAGGAARAEGSSRLRGVRLIFEGLTSRPGVRRGSPSRNGRGRPGPAAHSRSREPSATVRGLPVARTRPGNVAGAVVGVVSVKGGGLPAERGELARAGDRDDAGGLAPLVVRVRRALVQAMLGAPCVARVRRRLRRVGSAPLRRGPPGRAAGSRFRPAAEPSGPDRQRAAPFHMPSDRAEQAGRWMRCSRRTLLGGGGDD